MHETLKEQPLSELVKQFAEQTSRLARLEVELAKSSMQRKGRAARSGVSMLAVGALLALLGLGALTACAVLAWRMPSTPGSPP
jgi:Putative Actinobacterial Holin-X, holin superfamily III